jgi:hypothetical protein
MATARTTPFEGLTKLASDFVTAQQGMWDHAAWMLFLSHLEREGIAISEDMQARLGDLLEAMKEYHARVSSTEDIEKALGTVFNESAAFIQRQKGVWGHAEWEDFVKTIQQNTRTWSAGMEAYLGGVLESLKVFYTLLPAVPVEKSSPTAPRKPAPKSHSATKSTASSKEKATEQRLPSSAPPKRSARAKKE